MTQEILTFIVKIVGLETISVLTAIAILGGRLSIKINLSAYQRAVDRYGRLGEAAIVLLFTLAAAGLASLAYVTLKG